MAHDLADEISRSKLQAELVQGMKDRGDGCLNPCAIIAEDIPEKKNRTKRRRTRPIA
jgi:hypothetical protein